MTVMPQDADGNDVMPDFSASVPTLPVNPRDVVTLSGDDSTGTLTVETTNPVFSGFSPAHNTSGRDDRPQVSAHITDGDSGLDDDNIYVIFRITEGATTRAIIKNPKSDGELDEVPGGFEIKQRLTGNDAPGGDATIKWWVKAMDEAGNVGYSDRQTSIDGYENPCMADAYTTVAGLEGAGCQPFTIFVDGTDPSLLRAETGRHWESSLDTGDSADKTEYRVAEADPTSVLVVFDEHLDDTTVTAADFEVDGANPLDAEVHNVKVRDDSEDGDGNNTIMGDDVLDVGQSRGYVFLTVAAMYPNSQPRVDLVGEVSDVAGNRKGTGSDREADDRIAPTLTVTVAEGARPVTQDVVNLTITSNENISAPSVTYHTVMSSSGVQALGTERRTVVVFKSATEYTATVDPSGDGLYTLYVAAHDNSGGNLGFRGDNSAPVDVHGSTSAILFERDTNLAAPDVNPYVDGVQDEFITDDPNALIRIDFTGEGEEYDLDTYDGVTIESAMFGDEDITGSLQSNAAGNVFLYRASGLSLGSYDLSISATDEAGNMDSSALTVTIVPLGQGPCTPGSQRPECVSPTVSTSVATSSVRVRINSAIPMTATFSEPVWVLTVNEISVTNGLARNFFGRAGDTVYSFDVLPTEIGDVTVDVPAGVAEDIDGNGNTAAMQLSLGIPYDDDHDGAIGGDEILNAVSDYFGGRLTQPQILQLISLYFGPLG